MKVGWQTRKLGDVLEIQNGYAFNSKAFSSSEGMPLIRIRDLKVGTETETRFTDSYDEKYVVKAGDLLIGMDGKFGCYEWKGNPALLNQRVCRLQGFTSDLVPRFLFYGLNTYLKAIEDVTGYATVKHLSSKQILDIDFSSPPACRTAADCRYSGRGVQGYRHRQSQRQKEPPKRPRRLREPPEWPRNRKDFPWEFGEDQNRQVECQCSS